MRPKALMLVLLLVLTRQIASAESIAIEPGQMTVMSFSSAYKPRTDMVPAAALRYVKTLNGRWSLGGMYLTSLQSVFSGYAVGLIFDSKPTHTEAGEMSPDGGREVRTVAKWLLRGSCSAGIFRYLATLNRANPAVGEKPQAPIEAELYGIAIGVGLMRFWDERWASSLNLVNVSSLAANFSVTALNVSLGLAWYY